MALNQRLRGSASPVLTASGFVNGRWQFSTPTESTPLDRSPKNLVPVITLAVPMAVPNLVQFRRWKFLGKWVKYNEIVFLLFYVYLFSGTHLQVRPVDGFSCLMAQTTRPRARMCLLGVLLILLPILGVKYPKTPFWGRELNRRFPTKHRHKHRPMASTVDA